MKERTQEICIPVHPDDYDVPISLVHIPLGNGRYATLQGPIAPKTIAALIGTMDSCKDSMISKPEDFEI